MAQIDREMRYAMNFHRDQTSGRVMARTTIASIALCLALIADAVQPANATTYVAHWGIYHNSSNSVRGLRYNTATGVSSTQDFHGVLLKTSSCSYDAPQFAPFNKVYNNTTNTPAYYTPYQSSSGAQKWIHAGGHHWVFSGVDYNVFTADTICQSASSMALG